MQIYLPIYLFFHTIHVSFLRFIHAQVPLLTSPSSIRFSPFVCAFFFPFSATHWSASKTFPSTSFEEMSQLHEARVYSTPSSCPLCILTKPHPAPHANKHMYTHPHSLCRCLCISMNLQLCAVYCISAVCFAAYKINRVVPVSQLFVVSY